MSLVANFFLLLIFHCMYHLVYPFTTEGHLGCFQILEIMNKHYVKVFCELKLFQLSTRNSTQYSIMGKGCFSIWEKDLKKSGCMYMCNCFTLIKLFTLMEFPHSSVSKESSFNAGDAGSTTGSGRSPGGGHGTHSSILTWRLVWTEERILNDRKGPL